MDHDHNVKSLAQGKPPRIHDGPELPLETVALNGALEAAARSEPNACGSSMVRQHTDG